MVRNFSAKRSFSQLKYIENPIRTTMQQGRLDAVFLLDIEANVLHKFEDLIKDLGGSKKKNKIQIKYKKVKVYKNKHYIPSYYKFSFISMNKKCFIIYHSGMFKAIRS